MPVGRVPTLAAAALLMPGCSAGGEAGSDTAERATVIRDVTVLPMTGAPARRGATVRIAGGRIVDIVDAGAGVAARDGDRVIDGRGRTLIPGLVEMHAHASKTRASALGLFVVNGVTTLRDVGGDHEELLAWRREIRAGGRPGPRMRIAGPYLESARNVERMRGTPPDEMVEPVERTRVAVGSPARARHVVDSLAALELDFLKVRTVQDRETYLALGAAADRHGLPLVGHVTGIPPETILEAGQDGIEHFLYPTLDSLAPAERRVFWKAFAERDVIVVPTLVTFTESIFPARAELEAIVEDTGGAIEPRRRYLSRFLELDWREQLLEADDERRPLFRGLWDSTLRNLREMHAAGVTILAGSDAAVLNIWPGWSLHDELALFVDSLGMTPLEALQRATALSARALGLGDSIGTVEVGKAADLVLLEADPGEDIRNTRRISIVFVRGRPYDRAALERILVDVEAAPDRRVNDWPRRP